MQLITVWRWWITYIFHITILQQQKVIFQHSTKVVKCYKYVKVDNTSWEWVRVQLPDIFLLQIGSGTDTALAYILTYNNRPYL